MSRQLGEKIRSVRESRNVTLEQLGEKCGMPADVIAKIESGELVTSLTPLIKIARVLGVRLGTFLDDQESLGPVVTRSGAQAKVARVGGPAAGGGMDFFSLAQGKTGRHMEPFIIELDPASGGGATPSSHEGEEFIHVLEGAVEIIYGRENFRLETGDSIYYDSIVSHQVRSADGRSAKILAVVHAPL
ncbi:MAG TPA: XRE family transcriptional regulator [Spirochaetota bacterium]|nr:XRE family transcriptional regulator [Spirochaetota bacterium]HPH02533.1 XRE family transcriptional regulator [Spirochaetota bacterium]HPN82962.1 XRE family transcriptional regulator [Spirochaetota bacterium]